jgi:hypothetical protein
MNTREFSIKCMIENGFTFEGLIPFLSPSEQLRILKAKVKNGASSFNLKSLLKEKYLLLLRWKSIWEEVRPPKSNWHQLKGKEFSFEAKRARQMIESPELQRQSQQARLAILELYKTHFLAPN